MPKIHGNPEYQIQVKLPAPPDYPAEKIVDAYTAVPHGTFLFHLKCQKRSIYTTLECRNLTFATLDVKNAIFEKKSEQ